MNAIPALTLTQPFATLIAIGSKTIETRGWPTKYRGWLAIHAAKGATRSDIDLCLTEPFWGALKTVITLPRELPRGAVVALAWLADCRRIDMGTRADILANGKPNELSFGDYTSGRYAWTLERIHRLERPIPAKGALAIWTWAPRTEEHWSLPEELQR